MKTNKKTKIGAITVNATEFKSHALRLLDEAQEKNIEYIITKKGRPVAIVSPVSQAKASSRDSMKGMLQLNVSAKEVIHFDTSSDWEVYK